MKEILLNIIKVIVIFMVITSFVLSVMVFSTSRNGNAQSEATIDYVNSVITGEDPTLADTWLAVEYCENKVAYVFYEQEFKDMCTTILEYAK